jgi:hypothetical protein
MFGSVLSGWRVLAATRDYRATACSLLEWPSLRRCCQIHSRATVGSHADVARIIRNENKLLSYDQICELSCHDAPPVVAGRMA